MIYSDFFLNKGQYTYIDIINDHIQKKVGVRIEGFGVKRMREAWRKRGNPFYMEQ